MLSMHFVAVAYECMPILFANDFCNPKPLHLIFGRYGHYINIDISTEQCGVLVGDC